MRKIVLVSTCGFWEMENFDPLLVHIKAYCKNANAEFAGVLLRPHGAVLKTMVNMGAPVEDVLKAARDAGRQIVRDGKMSPETLSEVSRELLPRDAFIQMTNQNFRGEMERLSCRRELIKS